MKSQQELEILHLHIQDMLAGYVDNELDDQECKLIEAHLVGCEACANDVARQQLLHQNLSAIPHQQMTSDQQLQLDHVLNQAMSTEQQQTRSPATFLSKAWSWIGVDRGMPLTAATGWGVAVILGLVMVFSGNQQTTTRAIPMVEDAVAEYQHIAHSPLSRTDGADMASPPLSWSKSRMLSSWSTHISGKPAQVYAVRSDSAVLLQLKVGDQVFYNNPKVRAAVGKVGYYETLEQGLKVVAMPLQEGGLLLVGPPDSMPLPKKLLLKTF